MTITMIIQLLIVLLALWVGSRYGSLALGAISGIGLAILVFRLRQFKGILRAGDGLARAVLLGLSIQGVVVHLLNFLIERLLRVVQLQLLVLLLNAGVADAVARLEAVEDGVGKRQAYNFTQIAVKLMAETA